MAKNISEIMISPEIEDAGFGQIIYPPGGNYGPLVQSFFQIVVIESAWAYLWIGAKRHLLKAQDACLLLPGYQVRLQYARKTPTEHTWCSLLPGSGIKTVTWEDRNWPLIQKVSPTLQAVMRLGLSIRAGTRPADRGVRKHLGLSLFEAYIADSQGDPKLHTLYPPPVILAQQFMADHLGQTMNLTQIAQAGGVTPSHLIKLFGQYLKTTPIRYLWNLRVERGVSLLRDTGMSISEIAYRVGFRTPFHFSRLTRQSYQLSPRQLRKQFWDSPQHVIQEQIQR